MYTLWTTLVPLLYINAKYCGKLGPCSQSSSSSLVCQISLGCLAPLGKLQQAVGCGYCVAGAFWMNWAEYVHRCRLYGVTRYNQDSTTLMYMHFVCRLACHMLTCDCFSSNQPSFDFEFHRFSYILNLFTCLKHWVHYSKIYGKPVLQTSECIRTWWIGADWCLSFLVYHCRRIRCLSLLGILAQLCCDMPSWSSGDPVHGVIHQVHDERNFLQKWLAKNAAHALW